MDNLMMLLKDERTTDYFKDYAIMQVRIAFRIKEYLDADACFPPNNLNKSTMDLFLKRDVKSAVSNIFAELSVDCSSSSGYCDLQEEAVEFATALLTEYFQKINTELLSERERLLVRLGEIDTQLAETHSV